MADIAKQYGFSLKCSPVSDMVTVSNTMSDQDVFDRCGEDPIVICHDLLRRAVDSQQYNDEEVSAVLKYQPLPLDVVQRINLSFKRILRIENLWELQNLTCLELSNNFIETMENIQHMVNLERLDLSFNRINAIKNLDTLTRLQNLILFSNQITVLENLDNLTHLEMLSIGNNKISNLDNVLALRKLPDLLSVNLSGNPICSQPGYQEYVSVFLPIHFLDYSLISQETRDSGKKMFFDEITKVELLEMGAKESEQDCE